MAAIDPIAEELPSQKALNDIRRRFLVVNRDRLRRVQETLRPKQRVFLELLPLVFHLNDEHLPGYAGDDVPFGISDYSPPKSAVDGARKLDKAFSFTRRALRKYEIESLFFIGSTGTVAYTDRSDFDIWLCHRPGLGREQVARLRGKAEELRRWGASLELELHFFLMDAERFRGGESEALTLDGSGSAQHNLLRDEFYRTGILVAGKPLLWWMVPAAEEQRYEQFVRRLTGKRLLKREEYIDFGPVTEIPPGEFLSAALWQIYKGIDSPYKSVLKIQLLEAYADGSSDSDTLSQRYKDLVYGGDLQLDEIDPYVLMCNKVEEYLIARGHMDRLELARRCLYYKVGQELSRPARRRRNDWRRDAMAALADRWHWDEAHLTMLDSRPEWKIHRVLDERRALVNELTYSYRLLADYAEVRAAEAQIRPEDLNLLGRKLYAAFDRKAGKVDLINPGISRSLLETEISIHETSSPGEQAGWILYRGKVGRNDALRSTPLRRARSVLELLAWCHFNGLMNPSTRLYLQTRGNELSLKELREIAAALERIFPGGETYRPGMEELGEPARVTSAAVFVNIGVDPMAELTRQGRHLVSDRTDALNFGGARKNLALTFDLLLNTSWQEVLTFRFEGLGGLLACICQYLKWMPPSRGTTPPVPRAFSFSHPRGASIAQRIEELFGDIIHCYYRERRVETTRYLFQAGDRYFLLRLENDLFHYRRAENLEELRELLGQAQPSHCPTFVDLRALQETPLPLILEHEREGLVQVFFQRAGTTAEIYVADERGSLFHQSTEFFDSATLLNQLQLFVDSVRRRLSLMGDDAREGTGAPRTEYYELVREGTQQFLVKGVEPAALGPPIEFLGVQVIVEEVSGEQAQYKVYCKEREFTSLQYGEELFMEVARYVVGQRHSRARYPIYITDIELSGMAYSSAGEPQRQTVHYLNFKKLFEQRLNDALRSL